MRLDELLGERQAEADRGLLAAAALGGALEAVEHPGLVGRSDAAAIVGDDDPRRVASALGAEQHPAALVGVEQGVARPRCRPPGRAGAVAGDHADRTARSRARARSAWRAGQRLRVLGHLGAERGEIDLLLGEQQAAGVALGEIEDIVDQRAEPGDAFEDRGDIVARRSAAARRHSPRPASRRSRRSRSAACAARSSCWRRRRSSAGRPPRAPRCGRASAASTFRLSEMSSMVNSALPSGSGTAANSNSRPSIIETRPERCLRSTVALRTSSRTSPAWLARLSFARQQRRQRVDARMAGELLLLEAPQLAEAVVPQVEPPVRGEHADRLEQIVEGGGAHAQQGVAGRGELDLLGPVLEDDQQAAVGQRLGDDAQMLAAGQQPVLLVRREAGGEPARDAPPSSRGSRAPRADCRPRASRRSPGRIRAGRRGNRRSARTGARRAG